MTKLNFIETDRLILREFELEDAPSVLEFASNKEISRYTHDAVKYTTVAEIEGLIKDVWHADYKKYGYGRLALIEKNSSRIIGFCGLKFLPEYCLPDLGYRMLPRYWGKGYATESARAVVEYGFAKLGFEKILGLAHIDNVASQSVLLKLGFEEKETITLDDIRVKVYHLRR